LLFARIIVRPPCKEQPAQAGSILLMKSKSPRWTLKNVQLSYYRHRHLDISRL
jgi:hypothetical protein